MARVNTQTTYDVELTEDEKRRFDTGEAVPIELPDGNVIRVAPPGGNSRVSAGVEAGSDDDADPEEIAQLVEESQQETTPAPQGGDTEGNDENPRGGGMIEIERAGGGEEE